jgi:3-hydroxyisobutyrate dehydrogenase
MVAAHFIVARESLALARAAGLDTSDALGVINAATGGSTVTQIHFPTWVVTKAFDSGFTMSLMQKDIGLATALADQLELELPMARLTSLLWNDANAPAGDLDFTVMGDPDIISNSSGSETRIA